MRALLFFAITVTLISNDPAYGHQNARIEGAEACTKISSDKDRLDCFDETFSKSSRGTSSRNEGDRGNWMVRVSTNPIDDSKTVALLLEAEEGRNARGERISLIARCQSNKTEMYLNWGDFLGDDSTSVYSDWKYVTVRIGDGQATKEKWSISTDKQATFAPSWAGNYLKKMIESDKAVFQTTPYNESPITAIFDIRGLAAALKPLAETCNWEY
jgi:type VI secretion system VasI family protein